MVGEVSKSVSAETQLQAALLSLPREGARGLARSPVQPVRVAADGRKRQNVRGLSAGYAWMMQQSLFGRLRGHGSRYRLDKRIAAPSGLLHKRVRSGGERLLNFNPNLRRVHYRAGSSAQCQRERSG